MSNDGPTATQLRSRVLGDLGRPLLLQCINDDCPVNVYSTSRDNGETPCPLCAGTDVVIVQREV